MQQQEIKKKILKGVVVSDKMDKTIVVSVTRFVKHPRYHKFIKRTKRYKVHDEANRAKKGEEVEIMETKPRSKEKCFELVAAK